jgi:hypothetical protein
MGVCKVKRVYRWPGFETEMFFFDILHKRQQGTILKIFKNPDLEKLNFYVFDFFDGFSSVADPDPDLQDPHVFGPPESGSGFISQRYGSGFGYFYHQAKIIRKTLIPTAL